MGDKSRFSYDGLARQRLIVPMLREEGKLKESNWENALIAVGNRFVELDRTKPNQVAALAGLFADAEGLMALKDLVHQFNSELVCVEEKFPVERYIIIIYLFVFVLIIFDQSKRVWVGIHPK